VIPNPWLDLPAKPPFLLTEDEEIVEKYNAKPRRLEKHRVQLDILPEAFVGARDAPVVLLSNNPGYGKRAKYKLKRKFQARMRKNLRDEPLKHPFVHLDPRLKVVGEWWERKLKTLHRVFTREVITRSLLNVPYFPYPSNRFAHRQVEVPSQEYTFDLVREAMARDAVIVFMRRDAIWVKQIPALKKYRLAFHVKNTQNPTLNPGNLKEERAFEAIVLAIAKAEAKRW
jgi:hypothetical protein